MATISSHGEIDADALASLSATCLDGLRALQELQQFYDSQLWDIEDPVHAKIRHIHIHISMTAGRLASLIEPADHDAFHGREATKPDVHETSKIVADLLMHAAQLASAYGLELDSALTARYRQNAQRFAPGSLLTKFGAPHIG
jgi:hypothetical protein